MTLMRKCESCGKPIHQKQFVEMTIRILRSNEGENQDQLEQVFGDYCDGCVTSGRATEDLVAGLTKYKGLEADKEKVK